MTLNPLVVPTSVQYTYSGDGQHAQQNIAPYRMQANVGLLYVACQWKFFCFERSGHAKQRKTGTTLFNCLTPTGCYWEWVFAMPRSGLKPEVKACKIDQNQKRDKWTQKFAVILDLVKKRLQTKDYVCGIKFRRPNYYSLSPCSVNQDSNSSWNLDRVKNR